MSQRQVKATSRSAELAESAVRAAAILETLVNGVALIDMDGRITFANRMAESIMGLSREEISDRYSYQGSKLTSLDGHPIAPEEFPSARVIRTGVPVHDVRFRVERADGTQVILSLDAAPLSDSSGAMNGVVVSFTDSTKQYEAEQAVLQARESAERASGAKSEFLSRMSHELRTPLNSILGFAQLLEMSSLSTDQRENVAHVVKGGRHLLELINEVLDIARIEAGRISLSLEPVSVADVTHQALDLIRPMAAERGVSMSSNVASFEDLHIMADRQRLMQVLLNLLSNAVKYNREAGSVTLRWEEEPQEVVRLQVQDTGPGIPEAQVERLFAPFERLEAELSGVQGTGLGLALSKRLVEAMAGTIGVHSSNGRGSTFWVELPVATPIEPIGELPDRQAGGSRESSTDGLGPDMRTILYIEDNVSNVKLVERIMSHRPGVKLIVAMQGKLGIDLALEHRPLLVLLDLHLPDMDGSEVISQLRRDPRAAEIPIVVMSADATPRQIDRLLAAGARDYLTKPLDVRRVLATVDQVLPQEAASHA